MLLGLALVLAAAVGRSDASPKVFGVGLSKVRHCNIPRNEQI